MSEFVQPQVSVVLPVYNAGHYLSDAVNSILNQSFREFELIIVDDCSTDGSQELLAAIDDPRIRLVRKQTNTGIVDCLNTGISYSRADLVARMDADDISHPARLEKQYQFMQSDPALAVCGTWIRYIPSEEISEFPVSHDEIVLRLLERSPFAHPSVMLRKSLLEKHQLRYEKIPHAEDYFLWTQVPGKGKMANIPEVLLLYRIHDSQVSQRFTGQQEQSSRFCRSEFLLRMFRDFERTEKFAPVLFHRELISSRDQLVEFDRWCDELIAYNTRQGVFPATGFRQYLATQRCRIARNYLFYRHEKLRPAHLSAYFSKSGLMFRYFNVAEQLRFIWKCLFY